jgi:hypothetical protein
MEALNMTNTEPDQPVRAPQGAVGWTPALGWIYDVAELPTRVTDGHYVLVVSERDGTIRGISGTTTAPLVAQLRLDTEVAELVSALNDVAETFAERLAGRDGED